MTLKELLLQEINSTPNEQIEDLFGFFKSLKVPTKTPLASYRELLERIDYLEAIVGIRNGLDEFDQGKRIPAEQALAILQQKLSIPPRP
ncbi:hypothetical protein APA_4208 [Pseudanabaena sp. lw0831]|uniref:hypothetical protein n=1 Tax=Pseudanabaena sp. lw0831 TaxID=1357935 RepID=UPI0019154703|nr:hypothetical protein [Pseudanabaena sp. lw0831]GBO56002.1 hypothetical protein APA_4208 [Pseudanabaena sp. lw0831]